MNRYCYRCGAELPADAVFCHKCGFKMEPAVYLKKMLDCRQTRHAIYISESQAQTGGIIRYYIDEADQYVDINIEPEIVSGTEKTVKCAYNDASGNAVRVIRHIKVIVGDNGPAVFNPYMSTKKSTTRQNTSPAQQGASKEKGAFPVAVAGVVAACLLLFAVYTVFWPASQQTQPSAASNIETAAETKERSSTTKETTADKLKAFETDIADVIPHYEDRFYLKHLPSDLQMDAVALYKGISAFKKPISLPRYISEDEADLLVTVLRYDCPELFQISQSGQYIITTTNGKVSSISLDYSMSRETYEKNLAACESVVHTLVSSTKSLSNEAREKYVYDYLTEKITYSTTRANCGNAYGALVGHAAKCDGVSLAMKWVMEELGIPTIVICGQEKGDPYGHAWNCLYYNGHYYDVDLTNDLQSSDRLMKLYGAYNVPRKWMTDLYPLSDFIKKNYDVPTITTMAYSYHYKNDSLVPTGENVKSYFLDALDYADWHNGAGTIQFESEADYQKFLRNYDSYLQEWFDENGYGGSYQSNTLSEFRVVGFDVDID